MNAPNPSNGETPLNPDPVFRLDNRQALVTGGASGIGEATVKELARAGATVWIADLNLPAAEALAQSIGPAAHALQLDVTSPTSIAAAVSHLTRLDILVNNAGIGHVGSIETTEPEDFDRLINVNVRAVYLVTRALLPLLLAERPEGGKSAPGATIVNIASVSGLVGIKQRFAYCTSKGAIVAMTRQLAVDYPKPSASTQSALEPCKHPSSRATSTNSTRKPRKKPALNSAPASPSAASVAPRRSPPWSAI